MNNAIDPKSVSMPSVKLTKMAEQEVSLILENDFTLKGKYLRLLISGKGCDGFDYSLGFTDLNESDLVIPVQGNCQIEVIMDTFTAFYLQEVKVDYVQDLENDNEGFVITNLRQKEFSGKFWKKAPEKTPTLKDEYLGK